MAPRVTDAILLDEYPGAMRTMIDWSEHVGSRRKVRIERNRPSEKLLNGYVLARSNGLVLMHPFDDFEPDGYVVFREHDVVDVRSGEYERLWDRMLEGEGMLGGLEKPPEVDLSSMQAAIRWVGARHPFIAVHCEDEGHATQDFHFAEVSLTTPEVAYLRCVDALARWEPELAAVPIATITMVEFGTPYLTRFAKYIDQATR